MKAPLHNAYGPVWPTHDAEHMVRALGIRPEHRVLEVGGAGNPFPRANVVCDLTFGESNQRNGAPGVLRRDVTYVEAIAESLPFPDDAFDFVWCTHVLEHVQDPVKAASEFSRVAKAGFIEVPSRFGELLNGNPSHRWIVDKTQAGLRFTPRRFIEHPLDNCFYGVLFQNPGLRERVEGPLRNLLNHQVVFGPEGLKAEVPSFGGKVFNYDDPDQAARAHYSFARNALFAGADASYVYPDAVLAAKKAPQSARARLLLAVVQARLLRVEDARKTLQSLDSEAARFVLHGLDRLAAGEAIDPNRWPLPEGTLESDDSAAVAPDPQVSIVCVAENSEALLRAVESALVQDHAQVEVLAVGPFDAESPEWQRLGMGDRLRLLPQSGGNLGAWLNTGLLAGRGPWFGFCIGEERLMAHHVERLLEATAVGGGQASYADRLVRGSGAVLSVDATAGNPALAGLSPSCVLAHRDVLLKVGAFAETSTEGGLTEWIHRLFTAAEPIPIGEVSVTTEAAPTAHHATLDAAEAALKLKPMELLRDLIAAYQREAAFQAQIDSLEAELAAFRKTKEP